mgnify:CR=1 FL=1
MVVVFLANGFEEIEALATVDILRRAGLSVCTVGVGGHTITGAHGIIVQSDVSVNDTLPAISDLEAVVLPGGLPGTTNLAACTTVTQYVMAASHAHVLIAAICAAPSILGQLGLLRGKCATCYPGYEDTLIGATIGTDLVVSDGNYITAKGAGVTTKFALAIVSQLISPAKAQELGDAMQCQ